MLPRKHRLIKDQDFKAVFSGGRTYVNKLFVMKVLPTVPDQFTRYGFSASAKLGTTAMRNRAKRRLRESVRLLLDRLQREGSDVVLIARPSLCKASSGEIYHSVQHEFEKAGLAKIKSAF